MNNENYGIFNEEEIERKKGIIGKLSASPTGRAIIAAQLKCELKKRCNANGADMIMCNHICPEGILKIGSEDDAYIFWADMNKCSVGKELLLSVMKDMVEEAKQFMDTKIMIQIIESEEQKMVDQIGDKNNVINVIEEENSLRESWKVYNEYWKGIIEVNGEVSMNNLVKELCDYNYMLEQVPIVYTHITGGRMSKLNYNAHTVIAEADDSYAKCIEGCVREDLLVTLKDDTLSDKEKLELISDYVNELREYK